MRKEVELHLALRLVPVVEAQVQKSMRRFKHLQISPDGNWYTMMQNTRRTSQYGWSNSGRRTPKFKYERLDKGDLCHLP